MLRVPKPALALTCLLPFAAMPAAGQIDGASATSSDGNRLQPAPRVAVAPRDGDIDIDGRLIEDAWLMAIPVTQFVQGEPVEGAPPESRTEVRVLFDRSAIYVGARLYEDNPGNIADQLVRRDENGQYDYFELSLDPNNDRRTGYRFRVSAAGVQRDVYMYDDVREDDAWDAVWGSAVQRDSLGWSVEMKIPLSQVRFNASDSVQSWGINFTRRRLVTNEITYLALESRITHGKVSVFGRLDGLDLPRSARRIELRPYALANARTAPAVSGDPFFDGTATGTRVGLDMRLGLGASHTLNLTVNPDFGQVEVDPAVINLSAFETFFDEKRPFFVEDAQVFDFSLSGRRNTLFYSRRIGRQPHGSAPSGVDFRDIPTQTAIMGAAKLTGRTTSGFAIGAMAALTGRETGLGYEEIAGQTEFTVEPRSQYGAVRLQQDLRDGGTQIGTMVTVTNRELPNDASFDYLSSNAYAAGLDFEHNWGGPRSRDWALTGYLAGTNVRGSPTAMLGLQQRSNHYFQRPDATRVSLDSTATQMTGVEWRLEFKRQSARHWTGGVWVGEVTPGFEVNDLGFSQSGEKLDIGGRIQYQEIRPGKVLRNYRVSLWTFHNFRHEALDDIGSWSSWTRAHKTGALMANANVEFLNYWGINFRGHYSPQSMSDVATRGGPLMVDPATTSLTLGFNTDRRKTVSLRPSVTYEARHLGGYSWRTGLDLQFRPTPSWEIQLSPQYSAQLEPAQYVTRTGDVGYDPTYGRRYLFSDLERRSFSVQTRLNVAFSPTLTLQLYAQPLVSSGDYLTYKQLEQAESFDFDTFEEGQAVIVDGDISCSGGRSCLNDGTRYIDTNSDGNADLSFSDRDFNVRSLLLNAVFRWEFRPGSTVFLVWQQSRSERVTDGSFDFGRDVSQLWGVEPENMFIVKFTYWLGL
jgi:hypothetical protein